VLSAYQTHTFSVGLADHMEPPVTGFRPQLSRKVYAMAYVEGPGSEKKSVINYRSTGCPNLHGVYPGECRSVPRADRAILGVVSDAPNVP